MKNNAIIINTGRGEIIDIQALYNALNKKDVSLINYNIELLSKQYSANKETGIKIIA